MSTSISRDEWLAALGESAQPCEPDALTSKEIAAEFGMSSSRALRHMQALVSAGRARRTYKMQNGRWVPAYVLVTREKAPRHRRS